MIKKAIDDDWDRIFEYISRDFARNYFIGLGMLKGQKTFKAIYIDEDVEICSILFHRSSGNLQFVAYGTYDVEGMKLLLKSLDFNILISPQSYCHKLSKDLQLKKKGAIISKLTQLSYLKIETKHQAIILQPNDVELVEALYKTVFPGYPKAQFMKEKLLTSRGIGYCIKKGRMLSVAQSEFGYVLVGIATLPELQGSGYGSSCLIALIEECFKHHEALYLQYDNPMAGRLYNQLGFEAIDQVMHYVKEK